MILTKLDSTTGLLAPSTASAKVAESTSLPLEQYQMPEIAMVAIKIYAFGGLAFMVGVVLTAVSYWFWTVIIRREFADSPPSLELHPEKMRARERARTLRLNMRKEKKRQKKIQDEDPLAADAFTPPPVRFKAKNRHRTTSLPVKPALRDSIYDRSKNQKPVDSQSLNKGCGKRVSWASTLTLDNQNSSDSTKKQNLSESSRPPIQGVSISPIPPAQTAAPRSSTAIETRSRRGREMIGATTPEVSTAWAKPVAPVARTSAMPAVCKCFESIDPLDTRSHYCEIHQNRV